MDSMFNMVGNLRKSKLRTAMENKFIV